MKTINIAMISAVLLSSAAWAGADHPHGHKGKMKKPPFEKVDTNGDGDISYEEFEAFSESKSKYKEMFTRQDKNGDGVVSADEFKGKRHGNVFSQMDGDDNGELTLAEVKAFADAHDIKRKFFDKMDADSNGVVSQAEHKAFKPVHKGKKHRKVKMKHLFQKLDADQNGEITIAEAKAHMKEAERQDKLFKHFDANEDGVITKEEIGKARKMKLSQNNG